MNQLFVLSYIYGREIINIKPDWDGMVFIYFSNGEFEHNKWKNLFSLTCDSIKELKSED